ncbi:hypothetical protein [Bradyrhizobium sp.]|uniref:hypothetical protein n=1 Tax=Bradyrhizobium sp. TaxID=376 RepID=UPI002391ABB2|nr:hypothetical protein [Bradyrhizobium sp.]MDE1935765.1 hypothetical protein [Bradyrhizobium sp.]
MRLLVAALFSLGLGLGLGLNPGAAQAYDGCGPGCHAAVNGGCVVNGWEAGAVAWNECPAGAHPQPPCGTYYVWRKHSRMCMRLN